MGILFRDFLKNPISVSVVGLNDKPLTLYKSKTCKDSGSILPLFRNNYAFAFGKSSL